MHIVLIGGAGFIGRALTKCLLHRQATTVTWCQSGEVVSRPENVTIVPNLLALSTSDQDAVFGSADFVFYLASTTTPSSGNTNFAHEASANLGPFCSYLTAIVRQPRLRLIYLSSGGAVYAPSSPLPVNEDNPLHALSSYAAGKIAMEAFLASAYRQRPNQLLIVRPANVFGPGQPYNANFGFIRALLQALIEDHDFPIWGDGESIRDYLFIDDFTRFCEQLLSLDWPATIYNIGSGQGLSQLEVCAAVETVTGKEPKIKFVAQTASAVRGIILDSSRANRDFGWQAQTPLAIGISRTWHWLQSLVARQE